ncbi:MAG: class I SAM-dependent methyltransferase [Chitinophagales bacterium]|nr:class I SAM-dependent methyltransferase [Chitinophagales bacterium]
MSFLKKIRTWLQEPRLLGKNPDSVEFLDVHRTVLQEKPMMREVFTEFYDACINLDKRYFTGTGKRVEIGAGVSFFKKVYPEIVSTDIKPTPHLDMVVDALNMPFENNSIRAIYGINCFHHFPNPDKFFNELERVLEPGGGCVLIDPYHGPVASVFYKNVFDTEDFNKEQKEWTNDGLGVMMDANQALSYIVFTRDADKLRAAHPDLEIVLQKPLTNYMRYLMCGGLNFRQLMPTFMSPLLKFKEWLLSPLATVFGLHHVIVIRKRK